ncbi:hypothetical protein ACA135_01970 [Methanobrevibacter acididurans]
MNVLEFFEKVKESDKKYQSENHKHKKSKKKNSCNTPLEQLLMYQEL